ncbi:MAG: HNH endonuclease [Nocardiopsaceae bacterium]|jgi:hypothetical protein|nr:HNH endonuclease [Nocardiopsaceae bacterium]
MCEPQSDGHPVSASEALDALHQALTYLATADMTTLTTGEQADCLRGLERAEAIRIAAESSALTAFSASQGYETDGQRSAKTWLRWQARVTSPAAGAAVAWARRLEDHPAVRDALAHGDISPSWARQICEWSDQLPPSARDEADSILLGAAGAGAGLADLAGLAEEMRARTAAPDTDDGDDGADRCLHLDLHYGGAGQLRGDLTPRCAAALQALLDALGKRKGPEDIRTRPQRYHDALEDAVEKLIAAKDLPQRAGQPTQIQLLMTLDDLINGPARSQSPDGAGRAATAMARLYPSRDDLTREQKEASTGPGPRATPGDQCDASIVPVVTGHVDHQLLDQLGNQLLSRLTPGSVPPEGKAARLSADYARNLILSNAVALLSGPSGLASRLRTSQLTGPAASISLPLDVGTATDTIPPQLRRAVTLRDQHCGFAGCLDTDCQVHHIIPVSEGGPTSLENCMLGCKFHHLIAIHQWGWKVVLHADGTKTTLSPTGRPYQQHDPATPTAA